MDVGTNLFLFIFAFLPGIIFVQGLFLFQRVSVEYSDGLFEKVAYAIFFTPIIHLIAFGIAEFLATELFRVYQTPESPLRFWQEPASLLQLLQDVSGLIFLSRDTVSTTDVSSKLISFIAYQVMAVSTALFLAWVICSLSINFFGGLPGLRDGVYSITNGFVRRHALASVMCRDPQANGKVIIYNGVVNKVRMSKNGQIQHIYLELPEKIVGDFASASDSDGEPAEATGTIFKTSPGRLMASAQLEAIDEPSYGSRIEAFRLPIMFIDGEDIVNVFFFVQIFEYQNEWRIWFVNLAPRAINWFSKLRASLVGERRGDE